MNNSIFKTFFLSLCIMANMHFAYGQTASILPQAKTQFTDQNGKPLTSGTVDFYIPSTSTRKTTWQNSGETVANSNPVVLDSAGRAIIWGDGTYRQVVKDRNGNIIWDQITSSSGSGSSSPTATGDGDLVGTIKPWAGMTAPNQYAFTYGQELVRATYPALFTAITSSQGVFCNSGSPIINGLTNTTNFWIGMTVEISCVVAGFSTIISKTSSTVTLAANSNVTTNTTAVFFPWGHGNGTTTFNLPDFRGLVPVGNDNMGGVAAGVLTLAYFGATDPNSIGAFGGNQFQIITTAHLPPQTPAGTIVVTNGAITTSPASVLNTAGSIVNAGGAGGAGAATSTSASQATSTAAFTGTPFAGQTSTPFPTVTPSKTVNYIIKITPDTNSASASGVTSLGGMTGAIACGVGLLCTGNTISATSNIRTALVTNLTLFVRPNGNDTNCTGLANSDYSSGSFPQACAKKTWNGAYGTASSSYDFAGWTLTIQNGAAGNPTYAGGLFMNNAWTGGGSLIIDLNGSNIAETTTKGIINNVVQPGLITIENSAGLGTGGNVSSLNFSCIQNSAASAINIGDANTSSKGISTGPCGDASYEATQGGGIALVAPINVIGAGGRELILTSLGGIFGFNGEPVNFLSDQTYSLATIAAYFNSSILADSVSFSLHGHTITGPRYYANGNATIYTGNAGETYIPGTTPGIVTNGGCHDICGRQLLTTALTLYVAQSGSNVNNNCTVSTSPCGTINYALGLVANNYDLQCNAVTISVAASAFTATNIVAATPWTGACGTATVPPVTIVGASKATVSIASTSGNTISIGSLNGPPVQLGIQGVTLTSSSGSSINVSDSSSITITGDMAFGTALGNHINLTRKANLRIQSSYEITGDTGTTGAHWNAVQNSTIVPIGANTITVTGSRTFGNGATGGFVAMATNSTANVSGVTFSTTVATGLRYNINLGAMLNTGGLTFPGNVAGTAILNAIYQ